MKKISIVFWCLIVFIITSIMLSSCQNDDSSDASITDYPSNTITQTEEKDEEKIPTFTISTYSGTDDYGLAGSYTKYDSKKFTQGENITVTATVNSGYNFVGWFINSVRVSEELEYTHTVKQDAKLEARYNYYTLSTYAQGDDYGAAGSYTKADSQKVSVGDTVNLSVTLKKGYNFEGWYISGVCVSKDPNYSFVMRAEDVRIKAEFSYYTLTTTPYFYNGVVLMDFYDYMGTYDIYNEEKIAVGTKVTLNAQPKEGYKFIGWYIGWTCVSKDLKYTFTMEKSNLEIEAQFAQE